MIRDSIFLMAQCDSLERLVDELIISTTQLNHHSDSIASELEKVREFKKKTLRPTLLVPWWIWLIIGFAIRHKFQWLSNAIKTAFAFISTKIKTLTKHNKHNGST